MPRACAHDVVGGAVENASCCCVDLFLVEISVNLSVEMSYHGEAKEARRLLLLSLPLSSVEIESSACRGVDTFYRVGASGTA